MTYNEYPRMIYHPVEEPVVVFNEEDLKSYIEKGWDTNPGKKNEIAYLESVIKKTDEELKIMRKNLQFLKNQVKVNKEQL